MADISWPKDTLVKLIRRGSEEIIPNGQTTIAAGDMLVLAVDSGRRGQGPEHHRQGRRPGQRGGGEGRRL